MAYTEKKTLMMAEIINIIEWYRNIRENVQTRNKFDCLPTKIQFGLKRNMETLSSEAKPFIELRTEIQNKLQDKYFGEERSEEIVQTLNDKNGNPVLDENGHIQTTQARKIKVEFLDEYKKEVAELDEKLREILIEKTEVEIKVYDLDSAFEKLPDTAPLNIDDYDMIYFMDKEDDCDGSN